MNKEVEKEPQHVINKRRNNRLLSFFTNALPNHTFELLGSQDNPMIVMDGKIVLSCYAKNFVLIFNSQPKDGEMVYSIKLNVHEMKTYDEAKILNWLHLSEHRDIYRISFADGNFLGDYTFADNETETGIIPNKVEKISNHTKFFFKRRIAYKILGDLVKAGYDANIY